MPCDQCQALCARVQAHAAEHPPDAVLGDPDATPLLPRELGGNAARAESGMGEAEGDDPLLQVRSDFVGLAWAAALANPQRLEAEASELVLEAVVRRAAHALLPARLRDVAELLGEREQAQPIAEQHVITRHASAPSLRLGGQGEA